MCFAPFIDSTTQMGSIGQRSTEARFLIIPAGTKKLESTLSIAQVIVPVRVGFATPIPALSRAEVTVNRKYYAANYSATMFSGTYAGMYTETRSWHRSRSVRSLIR